MDESKQAYPAQAEAQEDASRVEARRQREKKKRENLRFAIELVAVVLAALLIRHYVFMLTIVSGSSMEETLHDHQIVAVDRLRYALADPQRGDIVICHYPNDSKNYVKRIVAIAGDWLQIQDGVTFLNGQALQEEHIVYKAYSDFGPYQVPEGCVFVMGDNRANSHDSRAEGALPLELLEGRVFAVLYPFDQLRLVDGAAQQEGG